MRASIVAIVFAVAGLAPALAAQDGGTATLTGRVLDASDSGAVGWAEVSVPGTDLVVRVDGRGNYRLPRVPVMAREFSVRALGYARLTQSEDFAAGATVRRDIYLLRMPQMLTSMTINGHGYRVPRYFEEVYRRGARGWGRFITREQIDSLNPVDVKMILNTVPGVMTSDRSVFFPKCNGTETARLYIDGTLMTRWSDPSTRADPYHWTEYLGFVNPSDIQAIEVYTSHGTVPAEFLDKDPCAVVAIWTKRGP